MQADEINVKFYNLFTLFAPVNQDAQNIEEYIVNGILLRKTTTI